MPVTTRKDRIFRHMAKEVPNYKVVKIDRDDLLDMPRDEFENVTSGAAFPVSMKKIFEHWRRLAEIKFGDYVDYETYTDYDIDYNRYRFVMVAREKPVRRIRA